MYALVRTGAITRTAGNPPEVFTRPDGSVVAGYHLRPDLWAADGWLPIVEANAGPGALETGTFADVIGASQVTRTWTNVPNTTAVNADTIRTQAAAALQANRDFVALAGPTNAQVVAQVKALSRQNNALIRNLLGLFDGTT